MILYREAFYVFRGKIDDAPKWAWWRIFITKNAKYDHVSSFYYDTEFDVWNLIEWSEFGTFYGVLRPEELDRYVVLILTGGGAILRYKAKDRRKPFLFPPIAWSYCISCAKHLANISHPALTPDQLFRALRRGGASDACTSVMQDGDEDGISQPQPALDAGP